MGRPEQDHAPNLIGDRYQLVVGAGGYRPGIDVTRVRHDQGLGYRAARCLAAEQLVQLLLEDNRVVRVEQTGDSGFTRLWHGAFPLCAGVCARLA